MYKVCAGVPLVASLFGFSSDAFGGDPSRAGDLLGEVLLFDGSGEGFFLRAIV